MQAAAQKPAAAAAGRGAAGRRRVLDTDDDSSWFTCSTGGGSRDSWAAAGEQSSGGSSMAVVVSGPPGCGKTAAVYALAQVRVSASHAPATAVRAAVLQPPVLHGLAARLGWHAAVAVQCLCISKICGSSGMPQWHSCCLLHRWQLGVHLPPPSLLAHTRMHSLLHRVPPASPPGQPQRPQLLP
jgi:hypothetical protein